MSKQKTGTWLQNLYLGVLLLVELCLLLLLQLFLTVKEISQGCELDLYVGRGKPQTTPGKIGSLIKIYDLFWVLENREMTDAQGNISVRKLIRPTATFLLTF